MLGWMNKLGGGFFRVLKTILILSIFIALFEKIAEIINFELPKVDFNA